MRRRYERDYMRRSNGLTDRDIDAFSFMVNALAVRNARQRKDFVDNLISNAQYLRSELRTGRLERADLAIAYFKVIQDAL